MLAEEGDEDAVRIKNNEHEHFKPHQDDDFLDDQMHSPSSPPIQGPHHKKKKFFITGDDDELKGKFFTFFNRPDSASNCE